MTITDHETLDKVLATIILAMTFVVLFFTCEPSATHLGAVNVSHEASPLFTISATGGSLD